MTYRLVLPLVALAGLSACSSDDILGTSPYDADADRLSDLVANIGVRSPTDPRSLPTSGSSTYDGVLGFNAPIDGARESVLGDLEMTSDFDRGEVFGSASGFHTGGDDRVGGTLRIDNGVIDRRANATASDPTFSASVRGVLTTPRGDGLDYRGTMDGNFYGPGHGYLGGDLDGTVDDGTVISEADGQFAATRR